MEVKAVASGKKFFPDDKRDELNFCIVPYKATDATQLPKEVVDNGLKFTAVGPLLPYSKEAEVTLIGEWQKKTNARTGIEEYQFAVTDYIVSIPQERTAIVEYLSTMEGCDADSAARLHNEYGDATLGILDNDVTQAKIVIKHAGLFDVFSESYSLHRYTRKAYNFLKKYKVPSENARHVAVSAMTAERIRTDPFLYGVISDLPYKNALQIAKDEGISKLSENGIQAAMMDILRQNEGNSSTFTDETTGNTYVERKELYKRTANQLGLSTNDERVKEALATLVMNNHVALVSGTYAYRKVTMEAEVTIAKEAARLLSATIKTYENLNADIDELNNKKGMRVAPQQRAAIITCLNHPFSLLIGGPGCGKTTIEQFIIELYRKYNPTRSVLLLAPTGKAARRMSESTGEPACTVHHGLGVNAGTEVLVPAKPLDAGLILVDEASMLDSQVASALLQATQTGSQLVLVGDTNQLPSVGAGNVLFELIASKVVPIARLTVVYRQKAGSTIAVNCSRIKRGKTQLEYADGVFTFLPAKDDAEGAKLAIDQFMAGLEKGLKIDDICLLTPYRQSTATGVNELNKELQRILHPNKDNEKSLTFGEQSGGKVKTFFENDKVMCMVNMGEDVSNGDTGFITEINGSKFTVDYGDGRVFTYPKSKMRDFELSYGMSIHKSQGQEFKLCIILACNSHARMLKRNIMYTAVSRAKSEVIIIGQMEALEKCIQTEDVTVRKSRLGAILHDLRDGEEFVEDMHPIKVEVL